MPYPTAWRPGRPSTSAAAAIASPWSDRRGNRFRPGRHFPGMLLAYAILDSWWAGQRPGEQDVLTRPMPDLSTWQHFCGPFEHPGSDYLYGIFWQDFGPEALACNVPIGNQAGAGQGTVDPGSRTLYFYYGPRTTNPARHYAYLQYTRPAGAVTENKVRQVSPAVTVDIPGVLTPSPPLVPVIVRPVPVYLTPFLPAQTLPEEPHRGYFPPLPHPPIPHVDSPPGPRIVSFVGIGPDVRSPPWDPERKVPSGSRAGHALTAAFGLLSLYGTAWSFIDALWQAIPVNLRTRNARNSQKLRELAANWADLNLGEAFANSLLAAVHVKLAGALYGNLTGTLADTFGSGPGFGLYRAWATGERAYHTDRSANYDPVRADRGGGSIASSQFSITADTRKRRRAKAREAVRASGRRRRTPLTRLARLRMQRRRASLRRARRARARRIAWLKARGS